MRRISTHMPNDDMQYHLRLRQHRMNELQSKMAEQTRVKELRDDPVAAAHSTKYQSQITRLERYLDNNGKLAGRLRIAEQYLQSANEVIHRVRELAIQGANGTYSEDQRRMMAVEVNSLLDELISIANAESIDGVSLFGGDAISGPPFRVLRGSVPGADGIVATQILYTGAAAQNSVEIAEGSVVTSTVSGGDVFWAERQEIVSAVDATTYVVPSASSVFLNGVEIELKAGDNVHAVIAKINDSGAAVKASLDPTQNSLVLRGTYPHQLTLEDGDGSSVLESLGVVAPFGRPPYNLASTARVAGGSMFAMVIHLRDRLFSGEVADIGGSGLKGIELAQSHLVDSLADLGSRSARLQVTMARISNEIPEVRNRNSEDVGLDLTAAILEMKMFEYAHEASLQTAGRILRQTLLDFLR